ncbi:MAG: TIGR03557 family F420-dependent LLM class oxidoreductase [Ilumatobacteraceae bacterium]
MTSFGFTLSSEEHPASRLVGLAALAEASGFDFVSISDHYHPWVDAQGHAPFVWAVLGALAERTSAIDVAVGVTCPIMRIHPAVLAQAAATTGNLLGDRFTWGVGTGEALNEHITGVKWPIAPERIAMLGEAVEVVRRLWTGERLTFEGAFFTVENAQIYDPPDHDIPIVVSAFAPRAAEMAGRIGDGLWTEAGGDVVQAWRDAGGHGPVYAQVTVCWAPTTDEAVDVAHRMWPNTCVPGQLSQDLPTPTHFEQASSTVTPQMIAAAVPCGPDAGPILAALRDAVDAGIDHVYLHQIGPDQEGFCRLWTSEIAPELTR